MELRVNSASIDDTPLIGFPRRDGRLAIDSGAGPTAEVAWESLFFLWSKAGIQDAVI
jgi:hypothetical protein